MPEMLDIYNPNLKHLGVKERGAVHRDGDWHRVFHCWVIYRDADGKDYIIVQKRSPDKATYANMLDVSAAGHYEAGETMHAGIREVQEELGLSVDFDALIPIGRRMTAAVYNDLQDYEIADVFFLINDQPLADYVYQKEELAGLLKIDLDEGIRLFAGDVSKITVESVGLGLGRTPVVVADFIPTLDHYFHKIFLLAKRCLAGDRSLFV